MTTINFQEALALLRAGESLQGVEVIPDYTPVEALEAVQLRAYGIEVPEGLVYTDYDDIDYSDIADTEEAAIWMDASAEEE